MTKGATSWGRRRAAVLAEAQAEVAAEEAALEAEQQQALAERSDEDILQELGLPDPETLTKGDDFAAYMARAVPEHIRKRALRKLWRSNPVLACVDGLNDYDEDYLTGSYNNAPIQTTYQVGKGLMAHVLEIARQDKGSDDATMPLDTEEVLADDEGSVAEVRVVEEPSGVPDTVDDSVDEHAQEPDVTKPRRMVFHFDGDSA